MRRALQSPVKSSAVVCTPRFVSSSSPSFSTSSSHATSTASSSKPKFTPGSHNNGRNGVMFDKILIANRGEIACRVMRTAQKLGIGTVAVYSDADAGNTHVAMADEAYRIGESTSADSYLRADRILDVALRSGAQAIHPGYGFLSESEPFARACDATFSSRSSSSGSNLVQQHHHHHSVTWIGPPPAAIASMGSKAASKAIMTDAGVPVTPGYWGDDVSLATLQVQADTHVGYPLMVKAVKGGGGKGMRVVYKREDLASAVEACSREAAASFGSSAVLIERYIGKPRHIEFQVFADTHGNAVYLWERDCSVQRRHQKVLEEAPAPFLSPETRAAMGTAAVRAALATGYVGAGTVEFMLDTESGSSGGGGIAKNNTNQKQKKTTTTTTPNTTENTFYFMEMNTRLQVEHPVTEAITGLDLIEWQLRVAAGQALPIRSQQEIDSRIRGHAIEARVYAENPLNNFLPATGMLRHLRAPAQRGYAGGPSGASSSGSNHSSSSSSSSSSGAFSSVRVDTGVRQGDVVSVFYDPMISKLIVHAEDRPMALKAMSRALGEYQVVGLPNNLQFLRMVISHPVFVQGGVDTSFLAQYMNDCLPTPSKAPVDVVSMAAFTHAFLAHNNGNTRSHNDSSSSSNSSTNNSSDIWNLRDGGRPGLPSTSVTSFAFQDAAAAVVIASTPTTTTPSATPAAAAHASSSASKSKDTAPKGIIDPNAHAKASVKYAGTTTVGSFTTEQRPTFAISLPSSSSSSSSSLIMMSGTLEPIDEEVIAAGSALFPGFPTSATRGKHTKGTQAFRLTTHSTSVVGSSSSSSSSSSPTTTTPSSSQVKHATIVITQEKNSIDTYIWPAEAPSSLTAQTVYKLSLPQSDFSGVVAASSSASKGSLIAPMPGKMVKILVQENTTVNAGTPLVVLEAMKMEHVIRAPADGFVVKKIHYKVGEFVEDGKTLVTLEAAAAEAKA